MVSLRRTLEAVDEAGNVPDPNPAKWLTIPNAIFEQQPLDWQRGSPEVKAVSRQEPLHPDS
jgi:hypothetical protein